MKKFNSQIITIIITFFFSSVSLFASDEPSLSIYKTKVLANFQFELCWLPGEKPTGKLALNGTALVTNGSTDCLKTSVVKAKAPYSFEIDGKVYKYSAGGAYIFTDPVKKTASKGGVFSHTFTFGANELPSAGLPAMTINGTNYKTTAVSANVYSVSGVPALAGRMVVKAAGKTFIYESQPSGVIVKRAAPKARILATGELELEYAPNEMPDNMSKVKVGGTDFTGIATGSKFATNDKTFIAKLSSKQVMNMRGATRSFSMAATPGADAALLPNPVPTTKLVSKSTTCGKMELTWNDPLEVPLNLKSVEINGENHQGAVVGGKFTTNDEVECSIDDEYDIALRGYDDPVTHSEILPIQLSTFDVKYFHREFVNIVNWTIESSDNVASYEVLRSFDGETFVPVHGIRVDSEENEQRNYQYVDNSMPFKYSGWVYYRLRNTDIDGTFEDHKIVAVDFKGRRVDTEISVYPNPAQDFVNINTNEAGTVIIFTQLGKLVYEAEVETGITEIDMMDFPAGSYFGKFIGNSGSKETISIQIAR